MEKYDSFAHILEQLAAVLKGGTSGVFFVATDANESARFGIVDGMIQQCSFRRLHGYEALTELHTINGAKCSFSENARFPFRDKDRVDHDMALVKLGIPLPEAVLAVAGDEQVVPDEPEINSRPSRTRLYRGQVVLVPEAPPSKKASTAPRPTKGQRMYRGRVIG